MLLRAGPDHVQLSLHLCLLGEDLAYGKHSRKYLLNE